MKHKGRSADSRVSRKTRASSVPAAVRGARPACGRSAALRRYRAPWRSLFQTPFDFTPFARSGQWDPRTRAENVSLSRRNGHISTSFSREMSASKRRFRTIRYRKIAKVVLNVFKTQVAAGADGRVEFDRERVETRGVAAIDVRVGGRRPRVGC